jgi:hypothetical protein
MDYPLDPEELRAATQAALQRWHNRHDPSWIHVDYLALLDGTAVADNYKTIHEEWVERRLKGRPDPPWVNEWHADNAPDATCPIHDTAMYYNRTTGEYACQDPHCVTAGGVTRWDLLLMESGYRWCQHHKQWHEAPACNVIDGEVVTDQHAIERPKEV